MKYTITINKRVRYLRAYNIKKKIGEHQNLLTKMFTGLLSRKPKDGELPA